MHWVNRGIFSSFLVIHQTLTVNSDTCHRLSGEAFSSRMPLADIGVQTHHFLKTLRSTFLLGVQHPRRYMNGLCCLDGFVNACSPSDGMCLTDFTFMNKMQSTIMPNDMQIRRYDSIAHAMEHCTSNVDLPPPWPTKESLTQR